MSERSHSLRHPGRSRTPTKQRRAEPGKDNGGSAVGEVVSAEIPGAGTITFVYVADPEGNTIELQHWSR